MNDTDHLPPERRLPPRRRDQILRSVLHGEEPNMSPRTRVRWIAPIAAAAAAALIAVGAVALTGGDDRSGGQGPSVPADNTEPLDLRALTEAELVEELGDRTSDPLAFTFHYARLIDGPVDPIPVIVAGIPDDQRNYHITGNLNDVHDVTTPTPADPFHVPEPGYSRPDVVDAIYGKTPAYWKIAGLYNVADTVDRVEVRVGTPDGPEPWRSSPVHGGYVFWATWFEIAEYEPGTELTVEWRAYDTDGNEIDADLLPDQPRTVTVP